MFRMNAIVLVVTSGLFGATGSASAAVWWPGSNDQGPSSSASAYIVDQNGAAFKALLSVGDAATNGYQMVGIPDGLGAIDGRINENGEVVKGDVFTVFMNHELGDPIQIAVGQSRNRRPTH